MNKDKSDMVTAGEVEARMKGLENPAQREVLMRFFKTGVGEYGEGDRFLGIKVPQTRAVVKEYRHRVSLPEIEKLLYSGWHEVRLSGFLLLVEEMNAALPRRRDSGEAPVKAMRREEVARFYLRHARQANNWDLVDLSCREIVGPYIRLSADPDYNILRELVRSGNLWLQRIAIVSTYDFIKNGIYGPTLETADMLIGHPHDLIHKAVGWMLRELGKKDMPTLEAYLEARYGSLPRTTLRYAIERMPEPLRRRWLRRR